MNKRVARLDEINRRILCALQRDANLTNHQLAEYVNLSPSACHVRVQALRKAGIIRRTIADLDIEKLPSSLSAFMEVKLNSHHPSDFTSFDEFIAEIPEIVWSYKISGVADYMLLAVVKDMAELRRLSDDLLERAGLIERLNTTPVIERTKAFAGFPIDRLFASGTER